MSAEVDFNEGLNFRAQLPFEFRVLDAELLPATLARLNTDNLQVLQADASIAESTRLVDAKDDERPWLADLARLEYKLDVLVGLVARLLARDAPVPASVELRVFAHGVEWASHGERPAVGTRGVAELYVNPAFPQPLSLPGVVVGQRESGEQHWTQVEFAGLTLPVIELLEKLVFRHHRRQIAEARGASAKG